MLDAQQKIEQVAAAQGKVMPLANRLDILQSQLDKAQARFDNGVLEISIPMTDQASRGRRIEIQGQGASTGGQRQTGQTPPVH